jgi:hypothetical protein
MKYTDKFWDILDEIGDKVSDIMIKAESNPSIDNHLNIDEIDKSMQDWCFDVKVGGKWRALKIGTFLREIFGSNTFSDKEIKEFSNKYNKLKNSSQYTPATAGVPVVGSKKVVKYEAPKPVGEKIEVPEWKWDPKNVRATFLSLVTSTYPYGTEEDVVPFVAPIGLQKDEFGNYYKLVGKSETMFTSHLDTADRKQSKVNLIREVKNGDEFIMTDESTILGADDKAGVSVMLYMISHNVPGIYYFFLGEERGGIGSGQVSSAFETIAHLKGVKRCVSFDRRNYYSVITQQLGMQCCSDEFGIALAAEYNKNGMKLKLDPTGIYTDSANFIDQIPECTNISVGYFNEHTGTEHQNMTFLEKLAKASISVNWESLPTVKKVGFDEDIMVKYKGFLNDLKACAFNMETKMMSNHGRSFVRIEMDEPDVDLVQEDLLNMAAIFSKNNMDPNIYFEDEFIKIELAPDEKYSKKYLESFDDWEEEKYKPLNIVEEEPESDSEIDELGFWVRKMFKNNQIDAKVESEDLNLHTYLFLERKEKISKLLKIFDIVAKVKNDLLTQYDVEVELYENKKGFPILKFDFYWSDEEDDDDEIEMEDEG